ncbi:MAG: glycosyltransferase family 9 protein [Cyclobacteriaceae bacterium]
MVKISAVIITFNEEKNIARCIDSVRPIADEILVVDSYSKDCTKKICLEKGVRFIEHPFEGHIQQKNFALQLATYEHVLSLDADEYLSGELTQSILSVKNNWQESAYRMNRLSNYGGKWIKHGSWYPDKKIRLWDRRIGAWGGENPHDKVILKGEIKAVQMNGDLMHLAYKDAIETLSKVQQYSTIFANENVGKRSSSLLKIIGHTFFAFVKSYVIKRGFLDGFEGLMVAGAEGHHVFYKYSKLYEANLHASIGKRVVISRTDNLGDVILTLPLAGYLKSIYPEVEIYFIGKKYTQAVISNCSFVDHFLDREEILKTPAILNSINADTIFFIYPDSQLARLADKLKIGNRVSTAHRWYNWLYCNKLVDFSRVHSSLHESQLNFKLLKPFRLQSDVDISTLSGYYGLSTVSKDLPFAISPTKFNLIVHPKTKGSAREWGLDNFFGLIQLLPSSNYQIYITGLKEEGELMRKQLPSLFEPQNVTDLTGKLTLFQLMELVNGVDGLIAGSTGVLHLAASLGRFTVGLYSPLRPIHPGRWKPIGKNSTYLVRDKECNDCRRSLECACIREITPNQVVEKINTYSRELKTKKIKVMA